MAFRNCLSMSMGLDSSYELLQKAIMPGIFPASQQLFLVSQGRSSTKELLLKNSVSPTIQQVKFSRDSDRSEQEGVILPLCFSSLSIEQSL